MNESPKQHIGIIGGTGLGTLLGNIPPRETVYPDTPFGKPSGPIILADIEGVPVALLQRHGPGHTHNPSQVPYRANVYALKMLGVSRVLATGAVGSLREELAPRDLVLVDQLIDRTIARPRTFFDELAAHVEFSNPFCPTLRRLLSEAAKGLPGKFHEKATYVCMEGPQFSTKAESHMHRAMGADLVGMTALPEAKLAREAELCYALLALPTDYDCWRPHAPGVTPQSLLAEIIDNVQHASQAGMALLKKVLPAVAKAGPCACQEALGLAIFTEPTKISGPIRQRLSALLGRVYPSSA
jgi:5'-methylthioadenosine phosphorylase